MPKPTKNLSANLGTEEWNYVFAIAMKIVKCESDAEDVAQEALLLAHRNRDRFEGKSRYSTWLYRIATTSALMHLRSKRRRGREIYDSQMDPESRREVENLPALGAGPLRHAMAREEVAKVEQILHGMPDNYMDLLVLRWKDGLSEREAARRLHLPLSTVKTRAFRGRRHVLSEAQKAA